MYTTKVKFILGKKGWMEMTFHENILRIWGEFSLIWFLTRQGKIKMKGRGGEKEER